MRRYRTVIVLILLVVVPLAGAILAARFLLPGSTPQPPAVTANPAPAPAPKAKTHQVLAAARELEVGTLIREEDLTALDVGETDIRGDHFTMEDVKSIGALRGHAVREALGAGAPLTRTAVVGPGQRGFLAAVLRPGTRATTIQLGAGTRHAGLIDPGDRVDVILTAKLRHAQEPERVFTRTILEDVRVVAVDRQVGIGAGTGGDGEPLKRAEIVTATLEVSPAQAGLLALGEHEGKLSLTVRPLVASVHPSEPGQIVNLQGLLDLPVPEYVEEPGDEVGTADPPVETEPVLPVPPAPKTVRVIRGSEVKDEEFEGEPVSLSDVNPLSEFAPPEDAEPGAPRLK